MALFKYPHVKDIWAAYLGHFVARFKGTKLERARDLFRQALSQVRAELQEANGQIQSNMHMCSLQIEQAAFIAA